MKVRLKRRSNLIEPIVLFRSHPDIGRFERQSDCPTHPVRTRRTLPAARTTRARKSTTENRLLELSQWHRRYSVGALLVTAESRLIDSVSLYTCVANGSTDEFVRAEAIQEAKAVQNMLQIGFHLSAQVHEINTLTVPTKVSPQFYHVSIIFDRKKITSCHCTCNNASSWCAHIVAVCLCRIDEVRSCSSVCLIEDRLVYFSPNVVACERQCPSRSLD